MSITEAMEELVESVRGAGIGDYFDGMDYDDIIVSALNVYRIHILERVDEILEDMEADTESTGDQSEPDEWDDDDYLTDWIGDMGDV